MRARWAGFAAATLIAAGTGATQFVTAGSAQARPPGNCDWSASSNSSGMAVCLGSGFTAFRVTVKCVHAGSQYTNYGDWVAVDHTSTAQCNDGDLLATAPYNDTASVFYQLS